MLSQRIVFESVNKAVLKKEEIGEIKDNQVLVEIAFSTISSGTERANITGDPNVSIHTTDTVAHFPRYSGYSSSGTVAEIGKNVTSVKVGDRVAVSWSVHGKYCILNEDVVYKIPSENISMSSAAVCHIASFPLAAIRKCKLEMGESALVMGLGVLGIAGVQLLKVAGAYPIIAADPIKEKRELALKIGADYAFDPLESDFSEKVKAVCGGINVAIEVTGVGAALNTTLDCMAKFGRVALLGCTRNSDFTVDYYRKVHGPGISLIGAHTLARPNYESSANYWTQRDDCIALLKLLQGNRLNFQDIIAETHSPENAQEVFDRLINDKSFPITQFCWSEVE